MVVFGDYNAPYYLLPKWMNVLQATNLGTKVVQKTTLLGNFNGNVRFKRLFWAFGVVMEGFMHCKPIIQIDGTSLYGKYTGKLLIATSIDANRHLFPLVFSLFEEETTYSWSWFFFCNEVSCYSKRWNMLNL